ncbi:MAG: hypothetical protein FWH31_00220 [Streptococcaceae bacterium]|nr:hypothetical protein [Streptococcaceae bacterium]
MKLAQKIVLTALIAIVAVFGVIIARDKMQISDSQKSNLASASKITSKQSLSTQTTSLSSKDMEKPFDKSSVSTRKSIPSTTQSTQDNLSGSTQSTQETTQKFQESTGNQETTLDWFNTQASNYLAQLILNENAIANNGTANLSISTDSKDTALAKTECEWNNSQEQVVHNYIPAPGGQNIAGGHYDADLTDAGAKVLAQKLFNGYYAEKTGYYDLIAAGYTPEQIVNGGAQVTVNGVTYSEKGMNGTGFETSSGGGVVSHYAEIANQVPTHKATKFSVSVIYDPDKNFVSTAADFFCGNVSYVYQMDASGAMNYVNY